MSTKCTLVSGKTFHLFEEALDLPQNIWLELDGCSFKASPQGIRVEIPLAIWEVIRQHSSARFDLAPLTDAQLRAEAEKQVDATRAEYHAHLAKQRAARKATGGKHRRKTLTSILDGDARLPRPEHVAIILKKLRAERSAQRKLQREITRLPSRHIA